MTRGEILSITEADLKGCEAINRLVHEKLGLCWHEWPERDMRYQVLQVQGGCTKCGHSRYTFFNELVQNPDYTHDIKAAWAIKGWLEKQPRERRLNYSYELDHGLRYEAAWASPLDRCKAFLLVDEVGK